MAIEEAEAAFYTVIRTKEEYARLCEGLKAWCGAAEWKAYGGRYVPRAAVFLRDRCYLMKPPRREKWDDGIDHLTYVDEDDFFKDALQRSWNQPPKYKKAPPSD